VLSVHEFNEIRKPYSKKKSGNVHSNIACSRVPQSSLLTFKIGFLSRAIARRGCGRGDDHEYNKYCKLHIITLNTVICVDVYEYSVPNLFGVRGMKCTYLNVEFILGAYIKLCFCVRNFA